MDDCGPNDKPGYSMYQLTLVPLNDVIWPSFVVFWLPFGVVDSGQKRQFTRSSRAYSLTLIELLRDARLDASVGDGGQSGGA